MRVIKRGKKIEDTMKVICRTCGAELEIQAEDIIVEEGFGYYPTYYYYRCPCCLHKDIIDYKDLTEEIRYNLRK